MPDREQIAEFFKKANPSKPRRHDPEQLMAQKAVGLKMADLITDPKWCSYVAHIEAVKENHERLQKSLESALLNGAFMEPKDYGKLKNDLTKHKAWVEALTTALSIVKTLIETGEKAEKELNSP